MDVETHVLTPTATATATPSADAFPYTLTTRLGTGSQGTTWLATHSTTGEVVAIKVFRLADAEDWKSHELFERECAVLRDLNHRAIPRFIGTHTDPDTGRAYLVMSLVEGLPLHTRLGRGASLSTDAVTDILAQLLDVLSYLHGRHPAVIHRDIKPRNILLDDTGRVSLVDFGGVRVATRPEGGSTTVGTFGYMAPEQLHGAATPASDIYALGAAMAALATGLDASDLPRKGLRLDLHKAMPQSTLRRVLEAMTTPDPEARLQDVPAVRAMLTGPDTAAATAPAAAEPAIVDRRRPSIPGGPLGLIAKLVLFALWLASTVTHAGLGLVERVVLPARYKQRRRALSKRYGHRPTQHDKLLDKLDSRHSQALGAVRGTRSAMRAVASKSEPYRRPNRRPRRKR